MKFRIGDRVRCIRAGDKGGGSNHGLKVGSEFTVTKCDTFGVVSDVDGWFLYYHEIEPAAAVHNPASTAGFTIPVPEGERKLVRTRNGYGYVLAESGGHSWVDTGGKAPVTVRNDSISAA